jgi:protein-tyrosine phosphatase
MASLLFVCLANICRSPAAEGVMRHLAHKQGKKDLKIDSCGVGDWYLGSLPDERITLAAQQRGIILSGRAKQFIIDFFDQYDYILACDHEVLNILHNHAKNVAQRAKIHLITNFSEYYKGEEIPDPFYGGEAAFDLVLDMLEDSCQGLLEKID